jgi:hypothetical protein
MGRAWPATTRLGKYIVGRCWLDLVASLGNESVSLAWLEGALEYAYARSQMQTLAYLEAVMEDVVFVKEMAERRKALTVG